MSATEQILWQRPSPAAVAVGPVGLGLCWVVAPGSPARNCTLRSGHEGGHVHEYSGVSWDRTGATR